MSEKIQLKGRVFIIFDIRTVTGLHIGGSDTGIEIGGVNKAVIRDKLTNRPYIPGSSLKGKIRSLLEKYENKEQNQQIGQGYIHSCGAGMNPDELKTKGLKDYMDCNICQVFGVPGERTFSTPTRLVVRDTHMDKDEAKRLDASGRTDLPYTEVKTEVSIDRVTSAANPRQMERVPADVVFKDAELVYSIYDGERCIAAHDVDRIKTILEGLQLLEDDYLGGLGTRGSGKVALEHIRVKMRGEKYIGAAEVVAEFDDLEAFSDGLVALQTKIRAGLAH